MNLDRSWKKFLAAAAILALGYGAFELGRASSGYFTVSAMLERFELQKRTRSLEDDLAFNTSIAGPVAQLVATMAPKQLAAVRGDLDPTLKPFRRDGGLVMPWVGLVTAAR